MSEEKKRLESQKGGAHLAKPGSKKETKKKDSKDSKKKDGNASWSETAVPIEPIEPPRAEWKPMDDLSSQETSVLPTWTDVQQSAPEKPSPLREVRAVLNTPAPITPITSTTPPPESLSEPVKPSTGKSPLNVPSHTSTNPSGPKRNKYADRMNKKNQKKKKNTGLRIVSSLLIVGLLAGGGYWWWQKTKAAEQELDPNATTIVTRGTIETYVEGSGVTAANKREELGKDLKGKVTEVLVEIGDAVKTGDKLLVVNPTETRAEMVTAEQELADAQRGVEEAQEEVMSAENEVAAVQKKMSRLSVTAPFTGKLVPVEQDDGNTSVYRVGQQVNEGEIIGYMVDDSQMKLSLYYNATYADTIQQGQAATVSVPSTMSTVPGTVSEVDTTQRVSSDGVQLIRVTVTMDNPNTLTKGMMATATVNAGETGEIYPADSGTLEYSREEAVTVQNGGEIQDMGGMDYYSYQSGATIMTLTSENMQSDLQIAQSKVKTAQSHVVSAQRVVKTKQDDIAKLQKIIVDSTLKATMDGVVVSMNAEPGQDVAGTEALVTIADLNDIIVNAEIASSDVSAVEIGQTADLTLYLSDGELSLTGAVKSVALEPKQDSGQSGGLPMFPAVISIDPVEGQAMSIGQGVQYRITTAMAMDTLVVPSSAIVNTESGPAVFAKPAEGETFDEAMPIPEGTEGVPPDFVLVPVEVGLSDSTSTEILWGVGEGTTVYLAVLDQYADDMMGGIG